MICVFSKWIKDYLEKVGYKAVDEIGLIGEKIYLYEENEQIKNIILSYLYI